MTLYRTPVRGALTILTRNPERQVRGAGVGALHPDAADGDLRRRLVDGRYLQHLPRRPAVARKKPPHPMPLQ